KGRAVLRKALLVGIGRILFLEIRAIRQEDFAQRLRCGRAEDAALEALCDEERQIAAVIEMRVRQHDRVDVARGDRQRIPVPAAELLLPLEEAAIDENPP